MVRLRFDQNEIYRGIIENSIFRVQVDLRQIYHTNRLIFQFAAIFPNWRAFREF